MENLDGYLKNVIFGGFVHQNICVHLSFFFLNLIAIVYEGKGLEVGKETDKRHKKLYSIYLHFIVYICEIQSSLKASSKKDAEWIFGQ
jgi:hypothetical protein